MKQLTITLVKQIHANNCWAAALSMALQVFKIKSTESDLDKLFDGKNKGMNLDEVNGQLSKHFPTLKSVFISEVFTGGNAILSFADIKKYIDAGQPILIGVNDFNGHAAHALLIFGYDDAKSNILIADPWTGKSVEYSYSSAAKFHWCETMVLQLK